MITFIQNSSFIKFQLKMNNMIIINKMLKNQHT